MDYVNIVQDAGQFDALRSTSASCRLWCYPRSLKAAFYRLETIIIFGKTSTEHG